MAHLGLIPEYDNFALTETLVIGAEFVTMKQSIDAVRGTRYKLRMMGVPTSAPTYFCVNNTSIIHCTTWPE